MNQCEKMVARLECHWHAVGQALPELKNAVATLTGTELALAVNEIGNRFNLFE